MPLLPVRLLISMAALATASLAFASEQPILELAPIYTDRMVLQRDRPIPVTGTANPGAEVSVELEGQLAVTTHTDAVGQWSVALPARSATAGLRLTATSGSETVTLADVAVGDVFLCSGQSNMEFPLRLATDADNAIAGSARDGLRLFKVPRQASTVPLVRFARETQWHASAPDSARDFSAACYFMGVELHRARGVPIGLIDASWGGSFIEAWLDPVVLEGTGRFDADLALQKVWHDSPDDAERQWQARLDDYFASGFEPAAPTIAADPSLVWEEWGTGLSDFDGFGTYETSINLSARQAREAQSVELGTVDDIDVTLINGREVGRTAGWDRPRRYVLPAGLLRPGKNTLQIRVLDTGGGGGLYGDGAQAIVLRSGEKLPLDGEWSFERGRTLNEVGRPPRKPWEPTSGPGMLANGMIAPLGRIPLAGIAWYQGESNASDPEGYARLLPLLASQWRERFDTRRLAIVQLANFGSFSSTPKESNWAELREVQRRFVTGDSDAGLAVTIDVGDPYDIHPANKRTVGSRLASAMDGGGRAAPPRLAREGQSGGVILTFEYDLVVIGGLMPLGFELCSKGHCRFVDATLVGGRKVEVPAQPDDDTIRFLWSNSPITNLYDDRGVPIVPFELSIPQLP